MCSGCGIPFDGKGEWNFHNGTASNVITFFHYLMLILPRIIFLVLGEGDTFGINEIFGEPENKTSINFNKANGNGNVRWMEMFMILHLWFILNIQKYSMTKNNIK